jgi:hypothetical protein
VNLQPEFDPRPILDVEDVLPALKSLAAEQPEKVASCYYYERNEDGSQAPQCIVAHLFDQWGVDPETINPPLDEDEQNLNFVGLNTPMNTQPFDQVLPVRLTPEAKELLGYVQMEQDSYKPWGVALEHGVARWSGQPYPVDVND